MTYSAGDYLAILPTNPVQSVKRVLKLFNLSEQVGQKSDRGGKHLTISSAGYRDNQCNWIYDITDGQTCRTEADSQWLRGASAASF
jgi:hypothetical protein